MIFVDNQSQRAAWAQRLPRQPKLKQPSEIWSFSKYFGFPASQKPLKTQALAARAYVTLEMESLAIAALVAELKPICIANVT